MEVYIIVFLGALILVSIYSYIKHYWNVWRGITPVYVDDTEKNRHIADAIKSFNAKKAAWDKANPSILDSIDYDELPESTEEKLLRNTKLRAEVAVARSREDGKDSNLLKIISEKLEQHREELLLEAKAKNNHITGSPTLTRIK